MKWPPASSVLALALLASELRSSVLWVMFAALASFATNYSQKTYGLCLWFGFCSQKKQTSSSFQFSFPVIFVDFTLAVCPTACIQSPGLRAFSQPLLWAQSPHLTVSHVSVQPTPFSMFIRIRLLSLLLQSQSGQQGRVTGHWYLSCPNSTQAKAMQRKIRPHVYLAPYSPCCYPSVYQSSRPKRGLVLLFS